jgi:hypothetical protein
MSAPAMPSFLFAAIFIVSHVAFARALPIPNNLHEANIDAAAAPHVGKRDVSPGAIAGITLGVVFAFILAAVGTALALKCLFHARHRIQLPFSRPSSRRSSTSSLDLESDEKLRPLILISTPSPDHNRSASIESYANQVAADELQAPPEAVLRRSSNLPAPVDRAALARACAHLLEAQYLPDYPHTETPVASEERLQRKGAVRGGRVDMDVMGRPIYTVHTGVVRSLSPHI